MIVLLVVGFLGGLVTGLSPCILPVLPVIVAGGSAGGSRRRPYAIVAGLVLSFSLVVLVGGELLSLLHLPQDLLRDVGIAMLGLLAVGLLVPPVGDLLERPFARLGVAPETGAGSGLVLGATLGLVFVPCAGPVLATISVVGSTHRVGLTAVLLTLAYAAGVAVPLLVVAILSRRAALRWSRLRRHAPVVRQVAGVVLGLTALALALNLTSSLTRVPGYTSALEDHLGASGSTAAQLQALKGEHANAFAQAVPAGSLPDLGTAPGFPGITAWLNTPGNRPLTLSQLRGKVVLVDFWTYSCINCRRSLPHVEAWYARYKPYGLVVVGVHSPEFPFEHVVGNVAAAASQLGVRYPIAVDDNLATWTAFNNEYWPAEYLLDQHGHVRHTSFGEGDYAATEQDIRDLLMAGGATHLPPPTEVADRTPTSATTPESYVGYDRLSNYAGSAVVDDKAATYHPADPVPADTLAFGGTWTVHAEEATAGTGATLLLNYQATNVYLVLGGQGTVTASVDGGPATTQTVSGVPNLYTLVAGSRPSSGLLTLKLSPGVQAYDFTFG